MTVEPQLPFDEEDKPPVEGYYGRYSPPPPGKLYVRDPAIARANAIREAVGVFKASKVKLTQHLTDLASGLDLEIEEEVIEVESDFHEGYHEVGRGQGGLDDQHAGHAPPEEESP